MSKRPPVFMLFLPQDPVRGGFKGEENHIKKHLDEPPFATKMCPSELQNPIRKLFFRSVVCFRFRTLH